MVSMKDKGGWLVACRGIFRVRHDTLMAPDLIAILVHSSGYGRFEISWFSWRDLSTERHENAPVRCPCSLSAALHGAPRTHGAGRQTGINCCGHLIFEITVTVNIIISCYVTVHLLLLHLMVFLNKEFHLLL